MNIQKEEYYKLYKFGLKLTFYFAIAKMILILINNIKIVNIESFIRKYINNNIVSLLLLIIPSVIMIIMYNKAKDDIKSTSKNKTYYKEFIQLEGYIQTLIGFFIAILSIIPLKNSPKDADFSIGLIAFPISLALVTSILGWYFGSDIAPPKEDKELINDLNEDVIKLKKNINSLSIELINTKDKFKETTDIFVSNLINLFIAQKKTIEEYENSLLSLNKSKDEYRVQIKDTLISFKDDFTSFNSDIKRSLSSLNEKIFEIQEKNQNKQLQSVELFFTNLNNKISNDTENIKLLHENFNDYLNSITNNFSTSTTKISEFLEHTNILNENTAKNINITNKTLASIDNEFKSINNEITNIKKTILDDLYENHSLRNDIMKINESIQKLKPSKYISFSFSLFKRNKK